MVQDFEKTGVEMAPEIEVKISDVNWLLGLANATKFPCSK